MALQNHRGHRGTNEDGVRSHLGFEPDAMQERVLRSKTRRGLLNCCRQWGKSTITAAKAVQQARGTAGSLTLVVSPSARQSGEFLRKVTEFARRLGIRPKGDGDNEISLLLVDEAARVSDELYMAIRPVVDLLRRARPGCVLMPVIVTGGEAETVGKGYYRVPKRDLITGLQVLFQRQALRIAAGLEYGAALMREMAEMRVKVTGAGHEQYGAWREGAHDDLVFAVALACWAAKRVYPGPPSGDNRWIRNENYREAERALRKALGGD